MNYFAEYNSILHIYINSSEKQSDVPLTINHGIKILAKVWIIAKIIVKNLRSRLQSDGQRLSQINTKIWLFIVSSNNKHALEFVHHHYKQRSIYLGLLSDKSKVLTDDGEKSTFVNHHYPIIHNVAWLFTYFFIMIKYNNKHRSFYAKRPDLFFFAYISKITSLYLLNLVRPKAIVFANDINVQSRALNIEARKKNIPTVYLQHAVVSSLFPPLNFDLALLEGEYSKAVYDKTNDTKIKIIGQPKFDKYKNNRKIIKNIRVIGVAFNTMDNISDLKTLLDHLLNIGYKIVLRPHPRETRQDYKWQNNRLKYSDSRIENAYEFLEKVDMLVASDSSIHLECTMMNIPSIYFNLNKGQTIDYYGFCKNGLVKSAADLVDIEKSIKFYNSADNSKLYKSAKYYCNSLENDVSAVQLAIDQIDKILNKA